MRTNSRTAVKICGITEQAALNTAIKAGADFVGFVFYPPSPRHITCAQAKILSQESQGRISRVGLFVDPTDEDLERALAHVDLDYLQLHGNESPDRLSAIKTRFDLPVIKALRIAAADDLSDLPSYEALADWLLFDSKPEKATLPGGTGHRFDWSLLHDIKPTKSWMLSGGLTAANIPDALEALSPDALDVSSGVEKARGVKDPAKIKAFIKALKSRAHHTELTDSS